MLYLKQTFLSYFTHNTTQIACAALQGILFCMYHVSRWNFSLLRLKEKEQLAVWSLRLQTNMCTFTVSKATDESARTGTDKDVLAVTLREEQTTQENKLVACPA